VITRRALLGRAGGGLLAAILPGRLLAAPKDEVVFDHLLRLARERAWSKLAIGPLTGEVGMALVGTPYVGGTLEVDDDVETCVVDLGRLDCVTFYEAALGFARMLKTHPATLTMDALRAQIKRMRYRGGHMDGYLSRLHYTSDWLYDNDKKGIVKLVSPHLPGAERMDKTLDFMSTHPSAYRQLKAHPDWVKRLAGMEHQWSMRRPAYLPKEEVPMVESLLETGDIIGVVTSTPGLDTSHTGLCYRDAEGALRFLHASSSHHQVELGPRLSEYLMSVTKDTGIMAARPMEPGG
jgi:hypothetical protein